MYAAKAVSKIPGHILAAFMARVPEAIRDRVSILENPTEELREELEHQHARGGDWRDVALFARNIRSRNGDKQARIEENYFYSSRRFPSGTNNTIGSGALVPGTFPLFTKGAGDQGDTLGFPTGFVLGPPETNLEQGGSIPKGTSFVLKQLGVSFNSDVSVDDLSDMVDNVTVGFSKAGGQFALSQGPLKMWPAGMGISGLAAVSTTGETDLNIQAVHNGAADIRAVRTLRIPRVLKENETFRYTLGVERGTKAKNGATIGLSDFVIVTMWLFGGQKNVIPG